MSETVDNLYFTWWFSSEE